MKNHKSHAGAQFLPRLWRWTDMQISLPIDSVIQFKNKTKQKTDKEPLFWNHQTSDPKKKRFIDLSNEPAQNNAQ